MPRSATENQTPVPRPSSKPRGYLVELVTIYPKVGSDGQFSPEPEVDILAVHDMAVDRQTAWISQGVNWLKDENMLPSLLPASRIMLFNYNSDFLLDLAIPRPLSSIAEHLLRYLISGRNQYPDRPILFVGHGFGGIVIEKALVLAKLRDNVYGKILRSTIGVVFLGTPHRGTPVQKIASHLLLILSVFTEVNTTLLEFLRLDSDTLKDLLYDFAFLVREVHIPLFCFYERDTTDIMRIIRHSFFIPTIIPLPKWPVLIANEKTSCIDGHAKGVLGFGSFLYEQIFRTK